MINVGLTGLFGVYNHLYLYWKSGLCCCIVYPGNLTWSIIAFSYIWMQFVSISVADIDSVLSKLKRLILYSSEKSE